MSFLAINSACKGKKATRIIVWPDVFVSDLFYVYQSTVNGLTRNSDGRASMEVVGGRIYWMEVTMPIKSKKRTAARIIVFQGIFVSD